MLLPFENDLSIDEANFRKHLRDVAAVEGLSAITINAHSTEVASCTFDEQRRVLDIAQDEIGARLPLDQRHLGRRLARSGAACAQWRMRAAPRRCWCFRRRRSRSARTPAMALAHFKRIADATDLPLIVFQYPLATGQGYPKDTLLKLCEEVPLDPRHQGLDRQRAASRVARPHAAKPGPRPVNVLTTHSAWLFPSLVTGCNGLLSGSGSVIADLQARLFRAVQGNDLAEAKRLDDRIEPTARVFYADPFVDMHNRMKEALVLLGKLPRAVVRPPLVKLERAEIARSVQALIEAGLLDKKRRATRRNWSYKTFSTSHQVQRNGIEPLTGSACGVPTTRLMLAVSGIGCVRAAA